MPYVSPDTHLLINNQQLYYQSWVYFSPKKQAMKQLKGYQNTTPSTVGPGISVGQYGIPVDFLNINEEELKKYYTLDAIAVAHARCLRYRGDSKMSVAQHCVRGADTFLLQGEPTLAFQFLFHEIAEVVTGDMSGPIKAIPEIKRVIKPIEEAIEKVILPVYGCPYPFPPIIKEMDINIAQDELFMIKHYKIPFHYWNEEESILYFKAMYEKLVIYMSTYEKREIIK